MTPSVTAPGTPAEQNAPVPPPRTRGRPKSPPPTFDFAPRYLSPAAAAHYTGLALKTLENWRRTGEGPAFTRVRREVRYDTVLLDAFMAARRVANNAEAHALAKQGGAL